MKDNFIRQLQIDASDLAQVKDRIATRSGMYFDRGYNVGGADEITDGDVQDATDNLQLGAVDVTAWVTLLEQVANFFDNLAVTTGDYDGTTNRLRSDI